MKEIDKVIGDIYQILGKYGEDREDIKFDFRKLCDHYKNMQNPSLNKNPDCDCDKGDNGYCCNLFCENFYPY